MKDIEFRLASGTLVEALFQQMSSDSRLLKVERIIEWLDAADRSSSTIWRDLHYIWQFCVVQRLLGPSARCLRLVAGLKVETNGVEELVAQQVNSFGWSSVAQEVEAYLCPANPAEVPSVGGRIHSIGRLAGTLPVGPRMKSLAKVADILECSSGDLVLFDATKDGNRSWGGALRPNGRLEPR